MVVCELHRLSYTKSIDSSACRVAISTHYIYNSRSISLFLKMSIHAVATFANYLSHNYTIMLWLISDKVSKSILIYQVQKSSCVMFHIEPRAIVGKLHYLDVLAYLLLQLRMFSEFLPANRTYRFSMSQ